jgi:AP-4 complex subunit mu-1
MDGINYLYIKKNGLYFVFTTRHNLSPSLGLELLTRLTKLFKDYCGILSEESIRTNFILVYELLDEIIDFGYPQLTNTETIKSYVFNQPIIVKNTTSSSSSSSSSKIFDLNPKTTPSTSVDKPINYKEKGGKKKNEIFVDIYERISLTFNSNGYILNSNIDGTIQMKSYLAGNPELKLALNEDLVIGKSSSSSQRTPGMIEVDDVNFHECARLQDFDQSRILSFQPPDGEFVLMNYRITGDTFRAPFRLFPFFELISPYKVELIVKVSLHNTQRLISFFTRHITLRSFASYSDD